jgi:ELWxxDGT repeat protein
LICIIFFNSSNIGLTNLYSFDLTTFQNENLRPNGSIQFESHNSSAAIIDNIMYFNGYSKDTGVELWQTDGTFANTKMVADIRLGVYSSIPKSFLAFKNKLYFIASEAKYGTEIWVYDPNYIAVKENKNPENSVKIYPNPADELLNIEVTGVCKKVSIFDLNGIKLFENQQVSNSFQIRTTHLSNGMYLISVELENAKKIVQKIIIQR